MHLSQKGMHQNKELGLVTEIMQFERKMSLFLFYSTYMYLHNFRAKGALDVPVSSVATYGCRAM